MLKLAATFLALTFSLSALAQFEPSIQKKHDEILLPTAKVEAGNSNGSGVYIFSREKDGRYENYVLTNHHVVSDAITMSGPHKIKKQTSEAEKEKDAKPVEEIKPSRVWEVRNPVSVTTYEYDERDREEDAVVRQADIVAYDDQVDLALLRTWYSKKLPSVVLGSKDALLPRGLPVWYSGSPNGARTFMTSGEIAHQDERIEGLRYILTTTNITFGSSGGPLFVLNGQANSYEVIGLAAIKELNVDYMGYFIPMETIRKFLDDNGFDFIK